MGYSSGRHGGIFDTWPSWRIGGFWIITLAMISTVVFCNAPVGFAAFMMLYLLPIVWKDPDDDGDPSNGMMVRGTKAYKVAAFISILKNKWRKEVFSLKSLLGFGSPEDDVMKGVRASMFTPPARLSAYMSLCFAVCFSFADIAVHPYLFPVWGHTVLPLWLSQLLSFFFFFMFLQALNTARRYHLALAQNGVDKVPVVMLNKLSRQDFAQGGIKMAIATAVAAASAAGVALFVETTKVEVPWTITIIGISSFSVSVGIYAFFRHVTKKYREEFDFQQERRAVWERAWGFKNQKAPFFEMESPVPAEPGKPGGPPAGTEPQEPHVWAAVFSMPANCVFDDYVDESPKLMSMIPGAEMITVAPMPKKNSQGKPIKGSVNSSAFRVWYTDRQIGMDDLLSGEGLTPEQKEIAVRVLITDPLVSIRSIGRCVVHSHTVMTAPESPSHIMKVVLIPRQDNVGAAAFAAKLQEIKDALGVKWAGVRGGNDDSGRSLVELYIGTAHPNSKGIVFPNKPSTSAYRKILEEVDWDHAFGSAGVVSPSSKQPPKMLMSRRVDDITTEYVFSYPAGVNMSMVRKSQGSLSTTTGNAYIELYEGIPSLKTLSKKEKQELDRLMKQSDSVAQFSMTAATSDPLNKVFYFDDYKKQLITGRERGVAKIAWSPGPRANGQLSIHDFNGDMAHLVIAGSSGSGKSVLIYSMLCQFIANNYPSEMLIEIIDPKIGFQNFQYVDNVSRYIDSWTPKPDVFFESVRNMLADNVKEMQRRNQIFRFAGGEDIIDKLEVARSIGIREGALPDGSPNPLVQPYKVLVMDEVAMLFAGAPDKETKEVQAEILYYATKLARESRSAGIHAVFATQYPTKESLPSIIKQQSGRIGLKTQDGIASKVIIDQTGLEEISIKGAGKVQAGGDFLDFRGFLMEDHKNGYHSMKDIIEAAPTRAHKPEIDGDRPGSSGGLSLPGDPDFIDIPIPDDAMFERWSHTPMGKLFADVEKDGGSSKMAENVLDKIDPDDLDTMSKKQFMDIALKGV